MTRPESAQGSSTATAPNAAQFQDNLTKYSLPNTGTAEMPSLGGSDNTESTRGGEAASSFKGVILEDNSLGEKSRDNKYESKFSRGEVSASSLLNEKQQTSAGRS